MKVKIGDMIYDSEDEPLMIILSKKDKENIANMLPECSKYCSYPDSMLEDDILDWMNRKGIKSVKGIPIKYIELDDEQINMCLCEDWFHTETELYDNRCENCGKRIV